MSNCKAAEPPGDPPGGEVVSKASKAYFTEFEASALGNRFVLGIRLPSQYGHMPPSLKRCREFSDWCFRDF